MSIEVFITPFEIRQDKENRWIKLCNFLSWDARASNYYLVMSAYLGAPVIDFRFVIGAMIIKHKLKLEDRETIETIKESINIQYFLCLKEYIYKAVFDRSLFTFLRYHLDADMFDAVTRQIILTSEGNYKAANKDLDENDNIFTPVNLTTTKAEPPNSEEKVTKGNKGKLIADATVADQMIAYPSDLSLLAKSREVYKRLIDVLCKILMIVDKPRTYRGLARKQYLIVAEKKHKTIREQHNAIGQQLRYLKRNLKSINGLLDKPPQICFPLKARDQKIFWVLQHIYVQQFKMYKEQIHSVDNRILNIHQPLVRPIVRGKDKAQVEFGAKLGVSIQNGYTRINTLSWYAYNGSSDLKKQVEDYFRLNSYYPKVIITHKIYGNQENRKWLKDFGIVYYGKPLGRPSANHKTPYRQRKYGEEQGMRNDVEGKFGQGKNGYNLSKIRARVARTSESRIAAIFFVMNLIKFSKEFLSHF
jgi:transposase, IS5 family